MKKFLVSFSLVLLFGLGTSMMAFGIVDMIQSAQSQNSQAKFIRQEIIPELGDYFEPPVIKRVASRDNDVVVLHKNNTLAIRSAITETQTSKLEIELLNMSHKLPKNATIYLVMDTPGGDIEAGSKFIDMAHSIPQKIKTITLFSASMGFHTVEQLGERLILPTGTLMSHRAVVGGLGGQLPGNAVTRMNFFRRQIYNLEYVTADRMGMNINTYRDLVRDEYWISGEDAVSAHVADKVVLARCGVDMLGTDDVSVQTMFGAISVTMSSCPLIDGVLAVQMSSGFFPSAKAKSDTYKLIDEMFNHRRQFVRDEIETNKFNNILK